MSSTSQETLQQESFFALQFMLQITGENTLVVLSGFQASIRPQGQMHGEENGPTGGGEKELAELDVQEGLH